MHWLLYVAAATMFLNLAFKIRRQGYKVITLLWVRGYFKKKNTAKSVFYIFTPYKLFWQCFAKQGLIFLTISQLIEDLKIQIYMFLSTLRFLLTRPTTLIHSSNNFRIDLRNSRNTWRNLNTFFSSWLGKPKKTLLIVESIECVYRKSISQ